MRSQEQHLPKVNAPVLRNLIKRPRLFALFDDAQDVPLVWVCGAPGEGKTSAVADYLNSRKHRFAWLALDEGDKDCATFFHYLGISISAALSRYRLHFPLYDGANYTTPKAYARQFFRYLASKIRVPLTLVFDNAQNAHSDTFYSILDVATAELPSFIKLTVLSRDAPPINLVRLYTNHQLHTVGPEQLRFTLEEANQLKARYSLVELAAVPNIHRQTEGWAAGLILALEAQADPYNPKTHHLTSRDALFAYFATEVFNDAGQTLQQLLLRTAYLPYIPLNIAKALCGHNQTEDLLHDLCMRNLFTCRIGGDQPTFQYHTLFREFLQNKAVASLSKEEQQSLCRQSARLLNALGHVDSAISTLLESQSYEEASELLIENAAELCRQGRQQLLVHWLEHIPTNLRVEKPWLSFWLGEAYLSFDDVKARTHLENAYAQFEKADDTFGKLLTAATVLEAMQWGETTYRNIEVWVDVVKNLYEKRGALYPTDELRIVTGRLLSDALLCRIEPELIPVSERLQILLSKDIEINRKLGAATVLLGYYILVSQQRNTRVLVAMMDSALRSPLASVAKRANWLNFLGYYLAVREGNGSRAFELLRQAEELAFQAHLPRQLVLSKRYQAELALRASNLTRVKALLEDIEPLATVLCGAERATYYHFKARFSLFTGDTEMGKQYALSALAYCREIELPEKFQQKYQTALLQAYAMAGENEETERLLAAKQPEHSPTSECMFAVLRAYSLFQRDSSQAMPFLRLALTQARELKYNLLSFLPPAIAREVSLTALEHNIEVDQVQKFAAERKLIKPQPSWEAWPWEIKIYCLGKLEILVQGDSPFGQGKAPRKVVELLSAILALGGRDVNIDDLIPSLWPGKQRVGEQDAFRATLYRLRKLLKNEAAVIVKDNRLSLNEEKVWVDAWALEAWLESASRQNGNAELSRFKTIAPKIFALYRGPLLTDSPLLLCSKTYAENLWEKTQHFLLSLGHACMTAADLDGAIEAYNFGVQRNPFANKLYPCLIRALVRSNRHEEAFAINSIYKRNTHTLLDKEHSDAYPMRLDKLSKR